MYQNYWCCWSLDYGYLFTKVSDLIGYFLSFARLRGNKNLFELTKEN